MPGRRWLVVAGALCLLGAGTIGFLIGINQQSATVRTCPVYVAPTQATATCDNVAYAIPLDNVVWRDAAGGWHDGQRPACLPIGPQQVPLITFASVDVTIEGHSWRPVVWVSC
jgi:hypothetical protein